jgi:hypothetical protein
MSTQPYRKARTFFSSQAEMAAALGVTQAAVSRWQQGYTISVKCRAQLFLLAQDNKWPLTAADLELEPADLAKQRARPGRSPANGQAA